MPPRSKISTPLADSFGNERKLTLLQARRFWPTQPRSYTAVWGACADGLLARNGVRVHLEHVRVKNAIFTSREAIGRFFQTLAEQDAAVAARVNGELSQAS